MKWWVSALALALAAATATKTFAAQITVSSSGNWSAITSGSGPGGQPSASDDILVNNNATLTVNVPNAVCASIQLSDTTKAGSLSFNSGSVLTCSGDVTVGAGAKTGDINMSSGGTFKIGGALTFPNGTFTRGSGTVEFNGLGAQTIPVPPGNTYNNFVLNKASGTATLGGSVTIAGNWINNNSGGSFSGGANTITLSGATGIGGTTLTPFPALSVPPGATVTMSNNNSCTSLTLEASSGNSSFTHDGTAALTVNGNVTITEPGGNNQTHAWNINAGSATVTGNLTLNNTTTTGGKVSKVAIMTGTLTVEGNLNFNNSANVANTVIDVSGGAGTLNLGGSLNVSSLGTLTPGTSSTINFNGTSAQTIPIGVSAVTYNNLHVNNTSASGAALSAAISAANVTGNLRVQSGTLTNGTFAIVGNGTKTFEVANGATFVLGGTSGMATGFGTKAFGASSTVSYAGTAQTVSVESYGNLIFRGSGAKSVATGTTVAGNLSITTGTASANLAAGINVGVGSLTLGGVNKAAGTWGSTSSSATYKNDTYFTATTGILTVTNGVVSTTAVSSSVNPSVFGQSVTFTATVTGPGGTPTGTVQFRTNGVNFGSAVALTAGSASSAALATLGVATHTVTAEYSGSENFNSSTGTLSGGQVVNKANTGTAVSSTVNPSVFGQSVTFTATVSATAPGAGTPGGTVQFKTNGVNFGSAVALSSGSASSAALATLGVATHTVTVEYSGDSSFNTSSGTLAGGQTVNKASTTNTLASSTNPALPGANVTFTATVSALPPGSGTPTGSIQFVTNGAPAGGPVPLTSGVAAYSTASLAHGSHTVRADYAGDSNFIGSTNNLSPNQIINTPPVAGTNTLGATQNTPVSVSAVKLALTATDADGDPLGITSVSATSTNGGSVGLTGSLITYTPPTDYVGPDSFTYTITDTFNGSATGTVNVTVRSGTGQSLNIISITTLSDGNKQVNFAGIPGRTYYTQATTNLITPDWTTIGTNVAGTNGLFSFTDLQATNYPSRFYRSAAP